MNHDIRAEKFGIALRPIDMADARFIYDLRRHPELSRHIGDVDERYDLHTAWLEAYFLREGDYYFCIERSSDRTPLGTIAIYNRAGDTAEWGRWVLAPGVNAANASAWLIYHVAFEVLRLKSVYCRSSIENRHVLSFHDRCGLERAGLETGSIVIRGEAKVIVIHTARHEQWQSIGGRLAPAARLEQRFVEGGNPFGLQP